MDYNIPIPIKKDINGDYICKCKYCSNPKLYITQWDGYSFLYNYCVLCKNRIFYYHQICSLYGRRLPCLVCFNCRIPYYEKGMNNREIHKMAKEIQLSRTNQASSYHIL